MLVQQASSYDVDGRNFHVQEKSMHKNLEFFHAGADQVSSADSLSIAAKSARPTTLVG
jgi:hypothetical protein